MKKLLLITLVCVGAFGLTSTKMNTSEKATQGCWVEVDLKDLDAGEWGSWTTTDCFKGLDFRVKRSSQNSYSKKYEWLVQFRNRYYEKVTFNYKMVPYAEKSEIRRTGKTLNRVDVAANSTMSGSKWAYLDESSKVYVYVNKLRFGKDYGDYAECDK